MKSIEQFNKARDLAKAWAASEPGWKLEITVQRNTAESPYYRYALLSRECSEDEHQPHLVQAGGMAIMVGGLLSMHTHSDKRVSITIGWAGAIDAEDPICQAIAGFKADIGNGKAA